MWFLRLFSDRNCLNYILPLGTLILFVCAAAGAVRRIYVMPDGYGPMTISAGSPPLMYKFQEIGVNPLYVALPILAVVLMVIFVFWMAGVKDHDQ